ncbi:IPT/TIG domain-containing protein [Hymenobacter sp. BT175]|uniref:IPT/TIG domain-containing protein n=1 Tax=Hymenobacter translucens TaxID=2886507 RepID=UPI001D0E9F7D|nr:IPT/TIG domain-containing protein [Hymenobacter translucens]MCC2546490.1 IPT/TIG domain-containing protein [Hymenobacter translucens]
MRITRLFVPAAGCQRCLPVLLILLLIGKPALAQKSCMLRPVPLPERVAAASLIVEASIGPQQVVSGRGGNLFTVSELTVFKVFQGELPAGGVRLAEPGGTLGMIRQEVSSAAGLQQGEQGVFLLAADPASGLPGLFRLEAGPQGVIRYDLTTRTAAEPFTRYPSISAGLYPALERLTGQTARRVRPNARLEATPAARAQPTAQPVVTSFSPQAITAGTGSVLTINGSNFGATQGNGRVSFPNSDNGGATYINANPTDYVLWSDTQIQLRVPSLIVNGSVSTGTGNTAGTGLFRVTNNEQETGNSPSSLTVTYALINVLASGGTTPSRPRLVNDDGQGGYTLQYSSGFVAVAGATASFERSLATWTCATRLRRVVSGVNDPTSPGTGNTINEVRFGPVAEVPSGVLGITRSYYSGCSIGGVVAFSLTEMDYIFNDRTNWQYGPALATGTQYDFETVALHELGHGTQLTHLIDPPAVMHFSVAQAENKRVLDPDSDIAGGTDVFTFSTTNPCAAAFPATFSPPLAAAIPVTCNNPLPVELVAFAAAYEPGRGTRVTWATASEVNSDYFAVETSASLTVEAWQEIGRVKAAGSSRSRRSYEFVDPASLSGSRYYRLRQADADGRTAYSEVAVVSGDALASLALFPNPATDKLRVLAPAADGQLTFHDLAGRIVLRASLSAARPEVEVSSLHPGLYLVEWTDGAKVLRGRLVKK